jgi:hypothetical protein
MPRVAGDGRSTALVLLVIIGAILGLVLETESKESKYRQKLAARGRGAATQQHKITMCTIIGNERDHLIEWIAYHEMLGVSQVLLYDLHGSDDSRAIVQPLVDKGLVRWYTVDEWRPLVSKEQMKMLYWEMSGAQERQISMCMQEAAKNSKWTLVIDPDEFIVGDDPLGFSSWLDDITASNPAGIYFNRVFFKDNGYLDQPPGSLTLATYGGTPLPGTAAFGKLLSNNDYLVPRSVHFMQPPPGATPCLDVKGAISAPCNTPHTRRENARFPGAEAYLHPYYVAHFVSRSLNSCIQRTSGAGASTWRLKFFGDDTAASFCQRYHSTEQERGGPLVPPIVIQQLQENMKRLTAV